MKYEFGDRTRSEEPLQTHRVYCPGPMEENLVFSFVYLLLTLFLRPNKQLGGIFDEYTFYNNRFPHHGKLCIKDKKHIILVHLTH
jgi:hypothetical protein